MAIINKFYNKNHFYLLLKFALKIQKNNGHKNKNKKYFV